jgi:DNA-binding response OmpR family regulator
MLDPSMTAHGASIPKPTILLVEGDASLRRWLAALLHEVGYQVLEAGERPEVLRHLRSHEPVHLVVTDARIGKMPGAEVAQETSNLRPGVPVVRLIGSMAEGLPVCRADLDPSVLLWKPFTLPPFLTVIRAQLSRPRDEAGQVRAPTYTFLP